MNTKTERKTGAEQSETIDVGALLMKVRAQVLTQSEDVGTRFAAEARKIHAGNAPERMIRGVVSRDEVVELLEEGVPVMPFPDPVDDNLH
ncbi:hypothetical protein HNQ59_003443 [Chitinivorax tropicus]|uniref:Uncharacterized protein n=1 Tax=Chitinivorax tropicus TaxID=714531 RepID=A0A840MSR5_9PROT|nr:hypothetical protein [Chitinivorax tropicus]